MFHRHQEFRADLPPAPPRQTVRLLQTEEELLAAMERAREFERRNASEYKRRLRSLSLPQDELADIVPLDRLPGSPSPILEKTGEA
jgi:hypothetical protein